MRYSDFRANADFNVLMNKAKKKPTWVRVSYLNPDRKDVSTLRYSTDIFDERDKQYTRK
jgi:hypothetical protein